MEEGDPFTFGTWPRGFVNQSDAGVAAAQQRGVEVVHGKANVVDSRAASGQESRDWRVGFGGLEEFHEGATRGEARDSRSVGVIQGNLGEAEDVTIERKQLAEGANGDPHVGDGGAAAGRRPR